MMTSLDIQGMSFRHEGGAVRVKVDDIGVFFVQPDEYAGIAQFFADAERRANTRYVLRKGAGVVLGAHCWWANSQIVDDRDLLQFTEDERPAAEVLAAKIGAEVVPL